MIYPPFFVLAVWTPNVAIAGISPTETMEMKRTPNYYDGYAGPNPIGGPAGDTVYAAGPAGYGGYKVEQPQHQAHQQQQPQQQHDPYGLGNNDVGSPTKRKADQAIYPGQGMRLGTPAAADADGDYEYDMNTYGASRSRNHGGLSAGDYDEDTSDLATVRLQNRSGKDVRMVINNHSNMNVPLDQSAGSSVSSNEYAPPTPSGDVTGYGGYSIGGMAGSVDSPPDGQKVAGSIISNPNSNTASSPTDSSRKKQKRNKPTLSCSECVERKTKVIPASLNFELQYKTTTNNDSKCDRGRPHCLSCIKRQTECKYAHVANLLEYIQPLSSVWPMAPIYR